VSLGGGPRDFHECARETRQPIEHKNSQHGLLEKSLWNPERKLRDGTEK